MQFAECVCERSYGCTYILILPLVVDRARDDQQLVQMIVWENSWHHSMASITYILYIFKKKQQ